MHCGMKVDYIASGYFKQTCNNISDYIEKIFYCSLQTAVTDSTNKTKGIFHPSFLMSCCH